MKYGSLKFAAVCVGLIMSLPAAAVSYFDCSFQNGIPENFTNIDRDCRELHFTMTQLGFSAQDAWVTLREEGTENYYAASASRFKTTKGEDAPVADDWLITPAVWIRADDAMFSWRAMSVNERNNHKSSYQVMISTTGTDPGDFMILPSGDIQEEEIYKWTDHEISLVDYCGKRVHLAFVNRSTDSDVLAIDDISVCGGSGLADLKIVPEEYYIGSEEISFGGVLTATSGEIVNSLSVSFNVGDEIFKAEYSGLNLGMGQQFEFTIPEKVAVNYGDTLHFSVTSSVNGIAFDEQSLSTTPLAFLPVKRIVVEEATGMWCGYCPEGTVAMHTLQERYPDQFIGVAVHVNDAMQVAGYGDVMSFPSGAPTAWIDRKIYVKDMLTPVLVDGVHTYTTLMGGMESLFIDRLQEQTFADISVAGNISEAADEIQTEITVSFAKRYSDADFRIILLLTEDHVWKPGYYQTNYHSGRDESLSGFEALPAMIRQDYEFNHVARSVMGGYAGIKGVVPSEISAGDSYSYSSSFKLPETILDIQNLKLIAMIADATTGEIMNAAYWNPDRSGIMSVSDDTISLTVDGDSVIVTAEEDLEIRAYDLSGICRGTAGGSRYAVLHDLPSGISIIAVTTPSSTKIYKVAIH